MRESVKIAGAILSICALAFSFSSSSNGGQLSLSSEPNGESAPALCQSARFLISKGDLNLGFEKLVVAFSLNSLFPGLKEGFEEYYKARIASDSLNLEANEGLAVLYQDWGRYYEASQFYKKCMTISPSDGGRRDRWFACGLSCSAAICDWDTWFQDAEKLRNLVRNGRKKLGDMPIVHPFDSLTLPLSISDLKTIAEQYASSVSIRMQRKYQSSIRIECIDTSKSKRIRIGYVSGDLMGTHPLLHLMKSVFYMHDIEKFDVFVYALNPDDLSPERRKLANSSDHVTFRDLSDLDSLQACNAIRADQCDILINLNGYAGTVKSAEIFSLRPSPLCLSYMGFPGTMGADWVDYIVADGTVLPEHLAGCYTERVLALPNCYFVNDYRQSLGAINALEAPLPTRESLGLPEIGTVMCNFNRLHKLDPITFGHWLEVLKEVKGVVLWLLDGGAVTCKNLRKAAHMAGVDPSRIIFAPIVSHEKHLIRLRAADIFADTHPYSAHTVGCDALWAGVPIITLTGESMASRVAASLLTTGNMSECIAQSRQEYKEKLKKLCTDKEALLLAKEKVILCRTQSPVFDTKLWVSSFEQGLLQVWRRYCRGLKPINVYPKTSHSRKNNMM